MKNLLITVFLVLPSPTLSQHIEVFTGDHDGFTRIVLQSEGIIDLKIVKEDNSVQVHPEANSNFNIENVFRRIGRDRVSEIYVDEGSLNVELSCDCEIEVNTKENMSVIDIREGATWPQEQQKVTYEYRESETNIDRGGLTNPIDYYRDKKFETHGNSNVNEIGEHDFIDQRSDIVRMKETRNSASATIGNMTIDDPYSWLKSGNSPSIINKSELSPPLVCIADIQIEVENWNSNNHRYEGKILNNMRLIDAKGEFSETRLESYIKNLIYLGLAAEAKHALNIYEGSQHGVLLWLSEIIDDEELSNRPSNDELCGKRSKFWNFVSQRKPAVNSKVLADHYQVLPARVSP